jgi:predicted membrane protein
MADYDPDRLRQKIVDRVHQRIDERMDRSFHRRHSGFGGLLIGTILAGIGVLLLLQNFGILYIDDLWEYWPLILIVFGVSRAASSYGTGGRVWGGVMVFIGGVFLLHNLGYIHGDLARFFWPVILIGFGVAMLARNLDRQHAWAPGVTSDSTNVNRVNAWAIFSGVRRRIESQDFEGGEALAIFGGIKLDFRQAATKKEEIVIEANALFGGIDIRVPETWQVTMRGSGVFGGYDDKTREATSSDAKRPNLVITGFAVFGGISVKN